MVDDLEFNHVKIFKVEWHLEVGQNLVEGNEIISSDPWTRFKKNVDEA